MAAVADGQVQRAGRAARSELDVMLTDAVGGALSGSSLGSGREGHRGLGPPPP